MMRSPLRLIGYLALLGLAASVASAGAAPLKHHRHPLHRHPAAEVAVRDRMPAFPQYIDQGSDRNPGGDNLYFTDTKDPLRLNAKSSYIIGPAYFQRWE